MSLKFLWMVWKLGNGEKVLGCRECFIEYSAPVWATGQGFPYKWACLGNWASLHQRAVRNKEEL